MTKNLPTPRELVTEWRAIQTLGAAERAERLKARRERAELNAQEVNGATDVLAMRDTMRIRHVAFALIKRRPHCLTEMGVAVVLVGSLNPLRPAPIDGAGHADDLAWGAYSGWELQDVLDIVCNLVENGPVKKVGLGLLVPDHAAIALLEQQIQEAEREDLAAEDTCGPYNEDELYGKE